VTAAERPVRLAARRDVAAIPMEFRGRRYWHLKDPVSLRYYQLRDEEHFVWGLLNGTRSLREILMLAEARFAPRRLQETQLYSFVALLHREGLVTAGVTEQGDRLLERGRQKRREAWLATLANPLAIRFRGFNPDRLLGWASHRLAWLFRPIALVLLIVWMLGAVVTLVPRWGEFVASMLSAQTFFHGDSLLGLAVALALVKVVHELAHGLACNRFGAECTELGLMLLVFTPCLYCNVSDAWTLPNKWQRISISAAGILAELALAAGAVFVWHWTEPGAINSLAMRVVLVCSLGTLFLNGNPLLRYDGYYVLADWLEIPNLQSQASDSLRRLTLRLLFGIEARAGRLDTGPPSWRLALYGLASLVYRMVILVGIVWFLYAALVENGFRALAGLFLLAVVVTGMVQVGRRAWNWWRTPSNVEQIRVTPRRSAGLVLVAGVVALLLIPLPCRVRAPAVLRPRDQAAVYAKVGGQLVEAAEVGEEVAGDAVLVELRNLELAREITSLTGQHAVQVQEVQNLRRRHVGDPNIAAKLASAEKTLESLAAQLREQQLLAARLTVKSPRAGRVIPPPTRAPSRGKGMLSTWSGSPLERRNRGAHVEAGTLLCYVGDPHQMEAVAVIDPSEVELVHVGQRVHVHLAGGPAASLIGEVASISEMDLDAAPPELVASGDLPPPNDSTVSSAQAGGYYEAVIRLEPSSAELLPGVVGRARIDVAYQSLWKRFRRLLGQTLSSVD
jgi:putative peptide zinc metalloprotease protein